MLKDYEHALFGQTSVKHLLKGLAKVLTSSEDQSTNLVVQDSSNAVMHFQKIVSHFYLVSIDFAFDDGVGLLFFFITVWIIFY